MRFSVLFLGGLVAGAMAVPAVVTVPVRTIVKTAVVTVKPTTLKPVVKIVTVTAEHHEPVTHTAEPVTVIYTASSLTNAPLPSLPSGYTIITLGVGTASGVSTYDAATTTSFKNPAPPLTMNQESTSTTSFTTPEPPLTEWTSDDDQSAPATHSVAAPAAPVASEPAYAQPATSYGDCETLHPEDPEFCRNAVDAHNMHRRNHSAADLRWDHDLYISALETSQSCNFSHQMEYRGGNYGQNLLVGASPDQIRESITNGWYNSEMELFPYYGQETPFDMTEGHDTGSWANYAHFTQLIWNSSTTMGCAVSWCEMVSCAPYGHDGKKNSGCPDGYMKDSYGHWLTTCNYKEAGNFKGLFDQNVFPAQNEPYCHSPCQLELEHA